MRRRTCRVSIIKTYPCKQRRQRHRSPDPPSEHGRGENERSRVDGGVESEERGTHIDHRI